MISGVSESVLRQADYYRSIVETLSPVEAAERILADITGYRDGHAWHHTDVEKLAGAIIAIVVTAIEDVTGEPVPIPRGGTL